MPTIMWQGNDELQIYTDQNHRVENGLLYIKAEREEIITPQLESIQKEKSFSIRAI